MTTESRDNAHAGVINEIRRKFFTFRNGIVADAFHKAGAPYRTVFGLQVPQLAQIARETPGDAAERHALAIRLWEDKEVRESRLLACWLFDPDSVDMYMAASLASACRTQEEADILCWRLLRREHYAGLAERLESADDEGCRRCAAALRR